MVASPTWLSDALAVADEATEDLGLVTTVIHEAWVGYANAEGESIYATPIQRKARVQQGVIPRRAASGDVTIVRARVGFLGELESVEAEGRDNPLDARDRITLPGPNSLTGPVGDLVDATLDPATGRPIRHVVWLR